MIFDFIHLLGTLSPLWSEYLLYIMCLMFVATVPCIIRKVVDFNV